jgi:hypothetical protein
VRCSKPSAQPSAQTTSPTQDMLQNKTDAL